MKELSRRQFFKGFIGGVTTLIGVGALSRAETVFAVSPADADSHFLPNEIQSDSIALVNTLPQVSRRESKPLLAQYGSVRRQCRRVSRRTARRTVRRRD